MTSLKRATALLTVAGFLAVGVAAYAADPTQADFDACNKEAQLKGGASASPSTSGAPKTGPSATTPTTPPSPSASPGAPKTGPSATTPTTPPSPSASPSTSGSTSGTGTSDTSLKGMAAAGQGDMGYQQAYKDCLKKRGF